MPLPYRTILHLPPQTDLIGLAEHEVQAWLEDRNKVDADLRIGFLRGTFFEPGVHALGGGRTLGVARLEGDDDGSRRLLLRFTEPNASGVWQVDVVALDAVDGAQRNDNLIIEATRVDAPDADGQVDPPAIVRRLLAREQVLDGRTPVTSEPRMISEGQVEEVLEAILDPARSVSVIVAASVSPDTDLNLRATISSLTAKLVGAASVFVVTSDAVAGLNERLPASHGIELGRVRTYLPHVDLENPADGRRHRVLGPQTFARAIHGPHVANYLQAAFAIQTRSALLAEPMPRSVRRRWNTLEDELARVTRKASVEQRVVEAREETLRDEAPSEDLQRQVGAPSVLERVGRLLARWLRRSEVEVELSTIDEVDSLIERLHLESSVLGADLRKAQDHVTDLELAQDSIRDDYEFRGLELAESEKEAGKLRDRVRYLSAELTKAGRAVEVYAAVDDTAWATPPDLVELALMLTPEMAGHPAATRVVFTGDLDNVSETQLRDHSGLYVQRCWEFVRALHDYAALRAQGRFEGNVHSYLQSPDHDGTKVPLTRHARGESKQTIDGWGDERVFPVPRACHPDEKIAMYAHFKAGQDNTFAPRMHYFDDTANTGKIYIGYIGRHLTNTKTAKA